MTVGCGRKEDETDSSQEIEWKRYEGSSGALQTRFFVVGVQLVIGQE